MKKVKLFLYNYGEITLIADFYKASHDAFICLKALNDTQVKAYGYLPEKIFYFVELQSIKTKHIHIFVDLSTDQCKHAAIAKQHKYNTTGLIPA